MGQVLTAPCESFFGAFFAGALGGHDELPLQPLLREPVLDVEDHAGAELAAVVADGLTFRDLDPGHDVTPRITMTAEGLSGAAS